MAIPTITWINRDPRIPEEWPGGTDPGRVPAVPLDVDLATIAPW